jgi:hypothetical protein
MFRSYDHHQAEKFIATLGLLNWQRIRCQLSSPKVAIYFLMAIRHFSVSNWSTMHWAFEFSAINWIRRYATSRKVAGSSPDVIIEFFNLT